MVDIARKNLFYDRTRLAITVVGVTFSVVLIFAQIGIYLGFMQNASIIIDNTVADIWITSKNSANFDFPQPFSELKLNRVKETPGIAWAEHLVLGWGTMRLPDGGFENVEIIGFNPESGVGGPWRLREGSIEALKAGAAIIVDESALPKLQHIAVGQWVEVLDSRVRVVGISEGVRGFTTAPYVFTSYRTAQDIVPWLRERTVFIVARVAPGFDPAEVAGRLREIRDVDVSTREEYSQKTRFYWTWQTGIGVGFSMTAVMAIVVGMVVVGQTIYSATVEHLREFGTLKAIGASNRDVYRIVLEQALINAVLGYAIGLVAAQVVMRSFHVTGLVMIVPPLLMVAVFGITLAMCLGASLISVRKAVTVDPLVVFKA